MLLAEILYALELMYAETIIAILLVILIVEHALLHLLVEEAVAEEAEGELSLEESALKNGNAVPGVIACQAEERQDYAGI